jgi:transcriptional regulator with XRE-family HTH domain
MSDNGSSGVATHFGRQLRRDRVAHGWSVHELSSRSGIDAGQISRIENFKRPPTARLALAIDGVFPERRGWYSQWLEDIRAAPEVPATFRSWSDYEDRTATMRIWSPGIMHGLFQTEGYARALIAVQPGTNPAAADERLKARMDRQRRVLSGDHPPLASVLVDELALYRRVGSAEVMAGQMRRLADVAAMPRVTLQVMPAIEHPANASGFVLSDDAAYAEHVTSGYVFTDDQTVSGLALRFDSIRGECYRVSESLALIERLAKLWATGASPLTAMATGATASRPPAENA